MITPEHRSELPADHDHPLSRLAVLEARNDWPIQPPCLLHAKDYDASRIPGPPHPYETASIWNRRVPIGSIGVAVSFACGALSVVIGLYLLNP